MSHFVILVIGNDVETQLAPYNEQPDADDPLCPQEFEDCTKEYLAEYNNDSTSVIQEPDGIWKLVSKEEGTLTRFDKMYPDFDAFCSDWHGQEINSDGRYGYWITPNAKWDWYEIGGRWSGYFKAKPGVKGTLGTPSWTVKATKPGCYDEIKKGDIDFATMMIEQRIKANEHYDLYEKTVAGLEVPKPWREFKKDFTDINDARSAYSELPYNKALNKEKLSSWRNDSVETYGVGRDTYVKRICYSCFVPYAVVRNGEWIGKGEMGWFGISNETVNDDDWNERIAEMLLGLPDDTLITAVDCHI